MLKVPDECYREYGADLDGCSTQEREGCGSCVLAKRPSMDGHEVKTLADALPKQITRVQVIIALYKTVPNGQFAAALMQADIDAAHKAMLEGDLPGMIASYKSLSGWKED